MSSMMRNFAEDHGHPPDICWPNGAGLALSRDMNTQDAADRWMDSHFENGPRAGWPRIRDAKHARARPAAPHPCGRAVQMTPWSATEAGANGDTVAAHGWRWGGQTGMNVATERATLAGTVALKDSVAGSRPLAWQARSDTSQNARALRIEQGGRRHNGDTSNDDTPCTVETDHGPQPVQPEDFANGAAT